MAQPGVLNPHPPEFDRFLHAPVGEDRNGYAVTVLSALARLDLDPWDETAELVMLGRDAAQARLGMLLARFRDVPALASDYAKVARDLSQLLPEGSTRGAVKRATTTVADCRPVMGGATWTIVAIIFVLFQVLRFGSLGSGE